LRIAPIVILKLRKESLKDLIANAIDTLLHPP
jgi:hypothetical protein